MRDGWIAFGIFMLLAMWAGCHYSENKAEQRYVEITNSFSEILNKKDSKIDEMNGQIFQIREDLKEIRGQRDNAQQKLAFWEANPDKLLSIYSNVFAMSPTNILQFESTFERFTNALNGFQQSAPFFSLEINGVTISTNKNIMELTIVPVRKDRQIQLRVINMTDLTVDKLSMQILVPSQIDKSNIIFPDNGWEACPPPIFLIGGQQVAANSWIWQANRIVPGNSYYTPAALEISTNYQTPALLAGFSVFSDKSKIQSFMVKLQLDK